MKSRRFFVVLCCVLICAAVASHAGAQSPSVLYTWDNTGNAVPNVEQWDKQFGTNTVTLSNAVAGELTITETGAAGTGVAIIDNFNRIRESSTAASGGLDLTGLEYLEFDLGHNGAGPINVQFYVNARNPCCDFVALGPDLAVVPGMNTYQVPITGLTPAQKVYIRTVGFNARDHVPLGNVAWTLAEVRSGGTPLAKRDLATHNTGTTAEGGLQGAWANFDLAAIQGNNGGQNQTGLSHDPAGSGSLTWTDLGGQNGAAISWGNGQALAGNTFNNREHDVSNYTHMIMRISATDPNNGGGTLGMNAFAQKNNFSFQAFEGGAGRNIPIDGKFHRVKWSTAGMTNMNLVDVTGLNLFGHPQNLKINVDLVRYIAVPEPASLSMLGIAAMGCFATLRRKR